MQIIKKFELSPSLTSQWGELVDAELCEDRRGRFIRLLVNDDAAELSLSEIRPMVDMLLDALIAAHTIPR